MAIQGTYGPENAKIVLVGDALSKYEYDNGIIINRYTKNLLLDFLEDAGFDSGDVLYVPCFSGSKLSGMKLDGPTLQEDAEEWLLPIIRKHQRRIVIGLGNNAVCALGLVDKPEGINKLRSKWLTSPKLPDIPLAAAIHPKLVSDKPDENGDDFFADLTYAKRIFDGDYEEQAPLHIIDLIEPDMIFDMLPEAKQFKRSRLAWDCECLSPDTLVTTSTGDIVELKDVKPDSYIQGSEVCPATGSLISRNVKAFNLVNKGVKHGRTIKPVIGIPITASDKHLFFTQDGWKYCKDLTLDDYLFISKAEIDFSESAFSDAEIAFVGWFIAEGVRSEDDNGRGHVGISIAEPAFQTWVKENATPWENVVWKVGGFHTMQLTLIKTGRCPDGTYYRNPAKVFLKKLGLFGKYSYEKTIPSEILQSSNRQIALLLRCMFTGDGTIFRDRIGVGYSTSSKRLAEQIVILLSRFGITCSVYPIEDNRKASYKRMWQVQITGEDALKFYHEIGLLGRKQGESLQVCLDKPDLRHKGVLPKQYKHVVKNALIAHGLLPDFLLKKHQVKGLHTAYYKENTTYKLESLRQILAVKEIPEIRELINAFGSEDFIVSRISSITDAGEFEVIDVSVETQQFTANLITVHNTSGLSLEQDLVTTIGFANGVRKPTGEWVARFWMGFDKLQPCFEDHILQQFGESFADFFNEAPNHYDVISGHNSIAFDDPMLTGNLQRPIPGCNQDTRLQKYVLQKYGNHGLKENVTRYLGYSDYDGVVDQQVKILAARRGKVIYELNEVVLETTHDPETGNDIFTKKQLVPNPTFEEDVFVVRWAGLEPEFVEDKKRGRKFKWPEKLDKKFAAWAMLDKDIVRTYCAYDAVYTWMLGDRFDEDIEADERLKMSSYWRHRFAKYLIKATQRGLLMDVEKNREISTLYKQIIDNAEVEINKEVAKLAPDLKEFNPNSQPQLRKVLFGDPVRIPHIDERSLYDHWDRKSVDQNLSDFHEMFYHGYEEIRELSRQGAYDYDTTLEAIKRAFVRHMGSVGRSMTFETPTRTNRDANKIYVQIVSRPVYAAGIYRPDPKAFTKGGEPSVAAQVLKNLYQERKEPILQLILMRSKAAKLRGTFLDGIYNRIDSNKVLHGEYNVTGARTGRLSSRVPNMQNFTPYLRGQLIARPGYRICTWDLSQAEVRVVAALTNDQDLMEAVYSEDFHSTTAMMVFGLHSIKDVSKQQRSFCKILNFMVIYGGSSFALATMLNISVEEAEELLKRYFDRFPALCAGLEDFKKQAATNYYVETVFGTRISTRNILSGDHKVRGHTERLAMNAPVQGSAGELTLYFIDEILRIWNDNHEPHEHIHLVNTTHDSASFEVPTHLLWNVGILQDDVDEPSFDKDGNWIIEARGPVVDLCRQVIEETTVPFKPLDTVRFKCDVEITDKWYGEPNAMKALDPDFETDKQTLPWHLILGASDDREEQEELEEINELEEAYYADRMAA